MEVWVDLDEAQIKALDELAAKLGLPRASLVREAIEALLANQGPRRMLDAFGHWGDHKIDGLEYQAQIRGELGDANGWR